MNSANIARERLRILTACLRYTAKHPGKPESIHDLRVAIRRFTQVLRVFDGVFDHSRKIRRRLRTLMDPCGDARNCDIALEVLSSAGVPADHGLERRLRQRRARAGRELARHIEDWHVRSQIRRWRGWLATEDQARTARLLPRLAREFSRAGAAAAKAGASFHQMHKFRLLVKRYRYTAEILGGKTSGPPVDVLRGLQERLGAINDCVTTADLIDDIGVSPGENRKIKAAVNRLVARRAADFRAFWRQSRRTK
jgi:CHAD domain-containing protein